MQNKVSVKGLVKSFGDLEVLKGMDVEIEEGEVVCLIGPSGSGDVYKRQVSHPSILSSSVPLTTDAICMTLEKRCIFM